jgi:phospholipid N-methyltransferase
MPNHHGPTPHRNGWLRRLSSFALFGREFVTNPGPIGAAAPSSRALSRRIAAALPSDPRGYVVELGPGTGSVTAALLERGIPSSQLLLVELSAKLVGHLRHRFPQLEVLEGDAARLSHVLRPYIARAAISHIVSSLPLRSLPAPVVRAITDQIKTLLPSGGLLVQYTYDLRPRRNAVFNDMAHAATSIVWLNLPPARVDVYHHRGS